MIQEVAAPRRRRAGNTWDAVGAAVFAVLALLVSGHIPASRHETNVDLLGDLLLVAAAAALGCCRRFPRAAAGVVALVLGGYFARGYPYGPVLLTGLTAASVLSWRTDRRTALAGVVAMCGAIALGEAIHNGTLSPMPVFYLGWTTALVFIAEAVRNRRGYLTQLEEHARYLELSREEEARRRVAEDRLAIARDLHDSVAHAMVVINVQAGAAAHVVDRRPAAAKDALGAIQRASGDVLDELAAMLALLRDSEERADRAPTPGAGQIRQLVDDATEATGLRVSLVVDGPAEAVPGHIGTAAYRIVQESLTNVIRHSGAAAAEVKVHTTDAGGLVVEVRDDGVGAGGAGGRGGTGSGIHGMRERAEATGGRLTAGPAPAGGFVVTATWGGRS